jgi:hypothetical protein
MPDEGIETAPLKMEEKGRVPLKAKMALADLLSGEKKAITRKWVDALVDSYPSDTRRFLRKEKSQFSNPVGQTYKEEVERLFDAFINDQEQQMASALDGILRIRAVQDFGPASAVGFLFRFRKLIREALQGAEPVNGLSSAFQEIEEKIDRLLLTAFEIYAKRREKIYDLRVKEIKRQVARLLARANLICEIPDVVPDPGNHETE